MSKSQILQLHFETEETPFGMIPRSHRIKSTKNLTIVRKQSLWYESCQVKGLE